MSQYESCKDEGIKCIAEGCGVIRFCRGVCRGHYNKLQKMVRNGKATWQELEEQGLILPKKPSVFKRF